ncbi:hypothetical protein ACP70R_039030 [Stipagrostis hirtigluma subsp. patula]
MDIFEASIQAGLVETQLPGRSHFLTEEEASVLGLAVASTILVDGAHTETSAKALSDVIDCQTRRAFSSCYRNG